MAGLETGLNHPPQGDSSSASLPRLNPLTVIEPPLRSPGGFDWLEPGTPQVFTFRNDLIGLSGRLTGPAPVQAEGLIGEHQFYFCSRRTGARLEIALEPGVDPCSIDSGDEDRLWVSEYGSMESSYLDPRKAIRWIEIQARRFLSERDARIRSEAETAEAGR